MARFFQCQKCGQRKSVRFYIKPNFVDMICGFTAFCSNCQRPTLHKASMNFDFQEKEEQQQEQSNEARKDDSKKLRTDLIPPEAITGLARALTYGVNKYDARNWEKGMEWGRVFGACIRHLFAYWGGEDVDGESGLLHLELALWEVMVLLVFYKRDIGKDTRNPVNGDTFNLNFNPEEVTQK